MNHIEWTEHKIMGSKLFKLAQNYSQIIPQSLLLTISIIIHFFVNQNIFVNIIFYGTEHNDLQRRDS